MGHVSQQNQPSGRHPFPETTPDARAGGALPDVGSRLTPPVPASGVPDVAPSVHRAGPAPSAEPEAHEPSVAAVAADVEEDGADFPSEDLVYGRIPVSDVSPVVEGGRFPATAIPGEDIRVMATAFREGHDSLGVTAVLYDPQGREAQRRTMTLVETGTDRYQAWLRPEYEGRWSFAVEGWSDLYDTWHHAAEIKLGVGQDVELMFQEASLLFDAASKESDRGQDEVRAFEEAAEAVLDTSLSVEERWQIATSDTIRDHVAERPLRDLSLIHI